jgi:hypothetical protein
MGIEGRPSPSAAPFHDPEGVRPLEYWIKDIKSFMRSINASISIRNKHSF